MTVPMATSTDHRGEAARIHELNAARHEQQALRSGRRGDVAGAAQARRAGRAERWAAELEFEQGLLELEREARD
jgi:hypothetical protein